jgi:hypothetical protein
MWISRKHPHSPSTVSKIYTCMCRIFEAFDCESSIAEFVYLWMIYGQKRHLTNATMHALLKQEITDLKVETRATIAPSFL